MKTLPTTTILAIVTGVVVIGMVTVGIQQVYAPRECPECGEFKKLSQDFIKEVIEAASTEEGPEPHIRELLEQYENEVLRLFTAPPDPD